VRDAVANINAGEKVRPEILVACQSVNLVDQSARILWEERVRLE